MAFRNLLFIHALTNNTETITNILAKVCLVHVNIRDVSWHLSKCGSELEKRWTYSILDKNGAHKNKAWPRAEQAAATPPSSIVSDVTATQWSASRMNPRPQSASTLQKINIFKSFEMIVSNTIDWKNAYSTLNHNKSRCRRWAWKIRWTARHERVVLHKNKTSSVCWPRKNLET